MGAYEYEEYRSPGNNLLGRIDKNDVWYSVPITKAVSNVTTQEELIPLSASAFYRVAKYTSYKKHAGDYDKVVEQIASVDNTGKLLTGAKWLPITFYKVGGGSGTSFQSIRIHSKGNFDGKPIVFITNEKLQGVYDDVIAVYTQAGAKTNIFVPGNQF